MRPADAATPLGEPRQQPSGRYALDHDTRATDRLSLPPANSPRDSVVTFLDRHPRAVFGTVYRTAAPRRRLTVGPTGGATMQQVADHTAQMLERHLNTGAPATRWRLCFETATGRAGICRCTAKTIALSVSSCCDRLGTTSETRSCTRSCTRSPRPAAATTPCGKPPRNASAVHCRPMTSDDPPNASCHSPYPSTTLRRSPPCTFSSSRNVRPRIGRNAERLEQLGRGKSGPDHPRRAASGEVRLE